MTQPPPDPPPSNILVRLTAYAAAPRGNRSVRTWTIDDLTLLLDPTVCVNQIMARLHIETRETVTYELVRLRRAGFTVPRRSNGSVRAPRTLAIEADLRAGMTSAEASRQHGVSPARVWEMRVRAGIPARHHGRTDEERGLVIAHQDRLAREVAELVGRSVRAVDGLRSQLIAEGRIRAKIVRPRRTTG